MLEKWEKNCTKNISDIRVMAIGNMMTALTRSHVVQGVRETKGLAVTVSSFRSKRVCCSSDISFSLTHTKQMNSEDCDTRKIQFPSALLLTFFASCQKQHRSESHEHVQAPKPLPLDQSSSHYFSLLSQAKPESFEFSPICSPVLTCLLFLAELPCLELLNLDKARLLRRSASSLPLSKRCYSVCLTDNLI